MALLPLLQQSWLELHKTPFHVLLFFVLILSFVYIFKQFRSGEPKYPPSLPKLPIIGNVHQLSTLPHRSLHALSKKYGPIMFLDLGCAPTVVVSFADMAKEIIKINDIIFSNQPETTAANFLYYGSTDVTFSQYGEYWRQAKKICVLKLLGLKRVQSFQYVREKEVEVWVWIHVHVHVLTVLRILSSSMNIAPRHINSKKKKVNSNFSHI